MEELAIMFRFAQLYTHNTHNLVARVPFFQDHEFLGELYPTYESDYDDIIERMIGKGTTPDLVQIQIIAADHLKQYPSTMKENSDCFNTLLMIEKSLCSHMETLIKQGALSQGTINLLADKCDKSEMRQYKIGQRIKK